MDELFLNMLVQTNQCVKSSSEAESSCSHVTQRRGQRAETYEDRKLEGEGEKEEEEDEHRWKTTGR